MGDTRKKKIPGIMRGVLAANVMALMTQEFSERDNKPLALAKAAGLSLSSVQRTLSGETGASIDTIERIALALGVSPYQLILPELDVENPQVVTGASAAEKRLYADLHRANIRKRERPSVEAKPIKKSA